MSQIDKIISKMKRQPNNISASEARQVLVAKGYLFIRQKGSHMCFRNGLGEVVIIAASSPLKAPYVRDILTRIGE